VKHVAIVGVGLIGGSFALALREAGFAGRITGVSSPATIAEALRLRVIDDALPLAEAAAEADLLYLAQPIGRILDTIRRLDAQVRPGALVTDAGSTKSAIVAAARTSLRRAQFLGGHPMAGKETRGAAAAEAGLFRGRTYVLTPGDPAELETQPARELIGWIEAIGARLFITGPDEHDRIVAFTSHLPQMLSTALGATVAENLAEADQLKVAGPGLIDSTRLALSSYELWRDILATNSQEIDDALAAVIQKLEHLRSNLRTREMQSQFEQAADLARRLRQ
jgi:prephenate dehydrogenase